MFPTNSSWRRSSNMRSMRESWTLPENVLFGFMCSVCFACKAVLNDLNGKYSF